jgi:hypothetical protein
VRAALLVIGLTPACAWGPGEPMGTAIVDLDARWVERADRDDDGWQRLASDFEVQVSDAVAELGVLALVDTGRVALNFDPARPPPGYTLCHNGHCHASDGRLVPYEEIAAELAGGAPPAPVLALPAGIRDLLLVGARRLDCDGPCPLPRATIGRIELEVEALQVSGVVRDRRDPPRLAGEVAWQLVLRPAAPLAIIGRTDLPVDRESPPTIALAAGWLPSAAILDGVWFERAAEAGGDPWAVADDPDSRAAVEGALGELALTLTHERR